MRVWETSHLQDTLPTGKTTSEHVYDFADSQANLEKIQHHFKQLKTRLVLGLVLGFLLPNALLSIYFHYQFAHTLKNNAKLNLEAVAESQKNSIDIYLQERIVNLNNLFHSKDFTLQPTSEIMKSYLQNLKRFDEAFIDVGFLDANGTEIGYAGPYSTSDINYSQETWYTSLISEKKKYVVSDLSLGSDKSPRFTIATRQEFDGQIFIMRASLNPDKLYMFLRSISHGKSIDSMIVNRQGQYQVVDLSKIPFQGTSTFIPPYSSRSGVEEITSDDETVLVAYSWFAETPWALLTKQPVSVVQTGMYLARSILTISLIVVSLIISIVIYYTINKLVENARKMAEKGQQLQEMLAHASKLASIGELAAGVAHEINNPLAIIMATSGVIRDMLNPEFELDHSDTAINKELTIIDNAATRAKGITKKLQDMGKTSSSSSLPCNINSLLEEVLNRLKKTEFKSKKIEVVSQFDPMLPNIMAEAYPLRQVFGNILINACDAITEEGTITISTQTTEEMVCVTINDTGKGIPPEDLKRIFNPFFTTKAGGKGTGLGLSIAASIVKYCGGTIKVNSILGVGSSFTVQLPFNKHQLTGSHGKEAKRIQSTIGR
ncbi:MAG: ATP-binding protein [Desulforhopalus sp.]|nr:ATP-binding protein [Desulforhopalus sp.]